MKKLSLRYSLKITCILLMQVISLKKMVALSVKFTILISRPHICILLILLSVLMGLASAADAILYNSMDSRHPWRTHLGVKESDRKTFVLILDSILIYTTIHVNEFVSISKLMQSCLYSVYLNHQL